MPSRLTISKVLVLANLATAVSAGQAQFYQKSSHLGIALAADGSGNGGSLHLHIESPTSYQWAAIGTGDKMDDSFMILMQPSGPESVQVTARSAHVHDEPGRVDVPLQVLGSKIEGQIMSADIMWAISDASSFSVIDPSDSKQPWIWAIGPRSSRASSGSDNDKRKRDGGGDGEIEEHSSYGIFYADMTKAIATSNATLALSGTSNIAVKPQGESYHTLVILHALLLGVAFVIVFPLGTIGLRSRWGLAFKAHWMLQLLAAGASFIGLAVAVALSFIGIEYNDFDETHQLLGLCVIALLVGQIIAGIWHHINFKKLGRRTLISYGHLFLGRILIYGGMVNAILGCLLSDDKIIAYVVAGISFFLACIMEYLSWRQRRRSLDNKGAFELPRHDSSSDIPLRAPHANKPGQQMDTNY